MGDGPKAEELDEEGIPQTHRSPVSIHQSHFIEFAQDNFGIEDANLRLCDNWQRGKEVCGWVPRRRPGDDVIEEEGERVEEREAESDVVVSSQAIQCALLQAHDESAHRRRCQHGCKRADRQV